MLRSRPTPRRELVVAPTTVTGKRISRSRGFLNQRLIGKSRERVVERARSQLDLVISPLANVRDDRVAMFWPIREGEKDVKNLSGHVASG